MTEEENNKEIAQGGDPSTSPIVNLTEISKEKKPPRYENVSFEDFFTSKGFEVTEAEIKPRNFKSIVGGVAAVALLSIVAGALITVPVSLYASAAVQVAEPVVEVWKKLPERLEEIELGERNKITDIEGNQIAEFWTEDRVFLDNLEAVGQNNINALLAAEDKDFYNHGAMDTIGTIKALLRRDGGGGSGITQQLVKNLQFYDIAGASKEEATEGSIQRKIKELKYSIGLEDQYSKDEILLQYFNTVSFGGPNTYSIEGAAQRYFNKSAKDLSIAQSSALVGTVKSTSFFNLSSEDEETKTEVKARQTYVLDRMLANEMITKEEYDAALAEELVVAPSKALGNCVSSAYPFYCDYIIEYLMESEKFGENEEERAMILNKGGLTIQSYIDPTIQNTLQTQLTNSLGNDNRIIAPTAVVHPETGGVLAMAANRGYGEGYGNTEINLPEVKTGTGSTYKMIALAAAFEAGYSESDLTFATNCPLYPGPAFDAPASGFGNSSGCGFQNGRLNPNQATAWSSNTWYVTLATKIGMDKVIAMTNDLGLSIDEGMAERSLSLVLGSAANSPIDMAAAFAAFANGGVYCPASPIVNYTYADGSSPAIPETYNNTKYSCRSVMSPATASKVLKAMRANTNPGEVNGAFGTAAYIPDYDAVGKSGTNEHLNVVWGQVSRDYSVFINFYDMDNPNAGIEYFNWRGGSNLFNTSAIEGSDVVRNIVAAKNPERRGLDYNNNTLDWTKAAEDTREYFTIPSLIGVEPAEALLTARSLGIKAEISNETRKTPDHFPTGVIVEQSLAPGEKLPVGSKKELILFVGE